MDEFERIARLSSLFDRPRAEVMLGIGDDCAVLAPSASPSVWTVDVAVEGVHFDRTFMTLSQVGYRAFMAAASDVAAMGARGVSALSSLVLPPSLDDRDLAELTAGIAQAAEACDVSVVGGNLSRGRELSLTTTVLGRADRRVVTRTGARPGEHLYVTGPLGASALGLTQLQRDPRASGPFVDAFRTPRARFDRAELVAQVASAAIDVSDGLFADLAHLCTASGVGARLSRDALPTLPGHAELSASLALSALDVITSGGEDYELLFTSAETLPADLAFALGVITEALGCVLVDADGTALHVAAGFDHFRARPT